MSSTIFYILFQLICLLQCALIHASERTFPDENQLNDEILTEREVERDLSKELSHIIAEKIYNELKQDANTEHKRNFLEKEWENLNFNGKRPPLPRPPGLWGKDVHSRFQIDRHDISIKTSGDISKRERKVAKKSKRIPEDEHSGIEKDSLHNNELDKKDLEGKHEKRESALNSPLGQVERNEEHPGWRREADRINNPPGLWGKDFETLRRPPGLWGRDAESIKGPPGLWGREIEKVNGPPGLWGREVETVKGPPGLWGREIEKVNGPPGLWGREVENNVSPPGLWGREVEKMNYPPGLWGREVYEMNGPPGLWGREATGELNKNLGDDTDGENNERDSKTNLKDNKEKVNSSHKSRDIVRRKNGDSKSERREKVISHFITAKKNKITRKNIRDM